ncbi:MAG: uncharacterized protein JWQ26_2633 [Modestobacter sp.]|nr:uncharacterized protein [Modestobacter sp.]
MPRYMFIVNYAPQGAKALMDSGGSARRTAVEKTASSLGGKLQTFDFALGADDVYTILELPDERAAAALALTVSGTGMAHVRTVVLLSPEDLDATAQLRPDYTPPGSSR